MSGSLESGRRGKIGLVRKRGGYLQPWRVLEDVMATRKSVTLGGHRRGWWSSRTVSQTCERATRHLLSSNQCDRNKSLNLGVGRTVRNRGADNPFALKVSASTLSARELGALYAKVL